MEEKTNYTVVGLAVLILTGALIAAGLWLSVGFDQKNYKKYMVYIHEAVTGLSEESPVKFNGVKVGFVSRIELSRDDPQLVEILLNIDEDIPITISTTATLISQGITGTSYLGLSASSSDLTPLKKAANQPYPVIPATPSLFNQLDSVIKEVSVNVNKVSQQISEIFDKENAAYIKKTLKNMATFTDVVAANNQHLNDSLKNADLMLKNVAKASRQFPDLVSDMKVSLKKFDTMSSTITTAGEKISDTMDSSKTAINKISQQTIPPAVSVLHRLENIAANLEKVSAQMRQNPAVIIRGTVPPPPGPGE